MCVCVYVCVSLCVGERERGVHMRIGAAHEGMGDFAAAEHAYHEVPLSVPEIAQYHEST